ncbi:MAG: glycosyltransferase, partial [Fusobacteriaceae bacterium]
KAIISTDCPTGPREILMNGEIGKLVSVGDIDKLALEIKNISQNEELRKKYGSLAKEFSKRFDTKEVMKKVEEII